MSQKKKANYQDSRELNVYEILKNLKAPEERLIITNGKVRNIDSPDITIKMEIEDSNAEEV